MGFEIINTIKKERGLTNAQISALSGVTLSTLDKITSGANTNPKLDTLQAICRVLGCSLNDFADDSEQTKIAPSDISEEARKIARSYDKMTPHGKGAVKAILDYEEKDLSHYSRHEENGQIVTLPKARKNRDGLIEIKVYDQPAAAGLGNYLDDPEFRVEQYPEYAIPDKVDFGVLIDGDSMEPRIHNGGTVFVQSMPAIDPGQIGVFVLNGKAYCKRLVVDQERREIRLSSLNQKYTDILVGEYDSFRTLGRVIGQWTPGKNNDDIFGW